MMQPTNPGDIATLSTGSANGKPAVDVRVVLFTIAAGELLVALEEAAAGFRLPRDYPAPGEPLDGAARRIVQETTGLTPHYHEQLYTLSVGQPPTWKVVVSYIALLCSDAQPPAAAGARWHPVGDLPSLSETDQKVIGYALIRLRAKIGYTNIAFHLLPETFTLTELQSAYETILGRRLDKRNFRRRVTASGILEPTDRKRRDGSHRPAALYRFRAEHDPATYLTPPWADNHGENAAQVAASDAAGAQGVER
ncbi:MAG TPA: NUDIX domain-containing protein [Thermomicrobiales bacterium]|jgi:8-oxo-dGTP diphosphatase